MRLFMYILINVLAGLILAAGWEVDVNNMPPLQFIVTWVVAFVLLVESYKKLGE